MFGWVKDLADDVKDNAQQALHWGEDVAGAAWNWAKNQAEDEFPFLGGGDQGQAPVAVSQSVNMPADRKRYLIEGEFLLDTFQGRVWRYDTAGKEFVRVRRALTETELDAVEVAHGLFAHMSGQFKERFKNSGAAGATAMTSAFDKLAASGKRRLDAHRRLVGTPVVAPPR